MVESLSFFSRLILRLARRLCVGNQSPQPFDTVPINLRP
jgi:hypothetical protein